jgi:hypothetical protein
MRCERRRREDEQKEGPEGGENSVLGEEREGERENGHPAEFVGSVRVCVPGLFCRWGRNDEAN